MVVTSLVMSLFLFLFISNFYYIHSLWLQGIFRQCLVLLLLFHVIPTFFPLLLLLTHQPPFFLFAWQIRAYCLPPQDRFPSQPQPQQVPTTYKFYTVGQVLLLPTWKLNQTS